MKIGILLLNQDPGYRGGVNSFIQGLLEGLRKTDKNNKYLLLLYSKYKKYYSQYLSNNFSIKTFPDENKWLRKIKILVLLIFTLPLIRYFYKNVEDILYFDLIRKINKLDIDLFYSPSAPHFPISINRKIIISPHDIHMTSFIPKND